MVERRVADLEAALAPFSEAERDEVAIEVSEMLGSFRSARDKGGQAVATVDTLMRRLASLPLWAIRAACRSIGENGYDVEERPGEFRRERHWAPSDPDIVHAVRAVTAARDMALGNARSLLAAQVEPPAAEGLPPPPPPPREPPGDGKHMERVVADLEGRKESQEDRNARAEREAEVAHSQGYSFGDH